MVRRQVQKLNEAGLGMTDACERIEMGIESGDSLLLRSSIPEHD